MTGNMKRQPVAYRPFRADAVLADGLLAVSHPGGEAMAKLAGSLFSMADMFGQKAEATAARRGKERGEAAGYAAAPDGSITGGDPVHGRPPDEKGAAGGAPQIHAPAAVRETISAAALRHGVDPATLMRIAQLESSLNPGAKNPNSSAGGLFQFVDGTAAQYGLTDRFDPVQAADAGARLLRDNTRYLTAKLGRPPTAGELYLAHQQGAAGAERLLRNPNAAAASVVGPDAVRLNGGHAGMTAGEFASLWTRKAGDAVPAPGLGPQIGRTPVSIRVDATPPGLTGRDTIFGRNYDAAARDTYMGLLDDRISEWMADIETKFADSPEDMGWAVGELRGELATALPEKDRARFFAAFDTTERAMLRKAQKKRDDRLEAEDKAAFLTRGDMLVNEADQARAGMDPADEDTVAVWKGKQARLKNHWREAAARGIVTEAQAADAIARIDGDTATEFYLAQAKGKTPDDIDTMREQMRKDYAAGKLEGVDARAWAKIDGGLEGAAADARAEEKKNLKDVADRAARLAERAAAGYATDPKELDALRRDASGLPGGDALAAGTADLIDVASLLRSGPPSLAEARVKAMRAAAGDNPDDATLAAIETAQRLVDKAKASMAADPLSYAERVGAIADTGSLTDARNPDDVERLVSIRVGAAQSAALRFGVAPRHFKAGEIDAIEAAAKADPAAGAQIAGAIVRGAGPSAPAVLKEFGRQAPAMSGAGAILAGGGSPQAAADVLAGAGKNPDGKAWPEKGEADRRLAGNETIGGALGPAAMERVIGSAEKIARKRIAEAGVEVDSDEAKAIHARALQEAAGAIYDGDTQWGGFTTPSGGWFGHDRQVAVPNFIRVDMLDEVIGALRDEDLAGIAAGFTAKDIGEATPILTEKGYQFALGDAASGVPLLIPGKDGGAFTLDLGAMAAELGRRVPGAIRGY